MPPARHLRDPAPDLADDQAAVVYTVQQCRVTIDQLRRAWQWLAEMIEPSRDTAPRRPVSDDELAEQSRQVRKARRDQVENLRDGLVPLVATPAAASTSAIDAQAEVTAVVAGAVARILTTTAVPAPAALRRRTLPGWPRVLDDLRWLDGVIAVDRAGAAALVSGLDLIRDEAVAAWVDGELQTANRLARSAAHVLDETTFPVGQPCPACRRRTLVADCAGADQSRWLIRCVSAACRCRGVDCPCDQPVRAAGRRHAWPRHRVRGRGGLWATIERHSAREPVGSARTGHGGWASRGVDRPGG